MTFRAFTDKEFSLVRDAVADTQRIKQRARSLMEKINAICEQAYPKESWGIELKIGENGGVEILTPYGRGRARLEMSLGASGAQGIYRIERESVNHLDQPEWHHVWSIIIDRSGLYIGDMLDSPMQFGGFNDEDNYAKLALSILYAIAKWPKQ